MADRQASWGIDIGQAGLKAVRLKYAEAAGQVMAVAFDYVPHAKILSQPDAKPDELIAQALQTFLSRNQVKGDSITVSVPGQTALARFISLPPVDQTKIHEIVKYEAKQQIPFALEDVIWDYQVLGSGESAGDLILDAEVGLFAMKREQVQTTLRPYLAQKVEIDQIQVATLALYNFLCHDRMGATPGSTDPIEEDEFTIILDMGADNTSLLATNGKKLWVRNITIGGNQFTRALTKEMKQTFAKAEHMKCNATKAPDPKAIFQALRPVFNDYVAEIQRSIGYFSSVNRNAKIKKIVGCGNGFKLAGLQKFLQQNLQMEVERVENFPGLVGDAVLNAPLFQENLPSFVVPYGLALQGLKLTRLHTSLLPPEITRARVIRKKKPWMLATAATLLFGLSTSVMGYGYVLSTVSEEKFKTAEEDATQYVSTKGRLKSDYDGAASKYKSILEQGNKLVEPLAGREHWLEVYRAINESLPRDIGDAIDEEDLRKKHRMRIYSITTERVADASTWFGTIGERAKATMLKADADAAPSGTGYVFTLVGRHFHEEEGNYVMRGPLYVTNTFLKCLQSWRVTTGQPMRPEDLLQLQQIDDAAKVAGTVAFQVPPPGVGVRQIGITHAVLPISSEKYVLYSPQGKRGLQKAAAAPGAVPGLAVQPGVDPASMVPGGRPTTAKRKTPRPGAAASASGDLDENGLMKVLQTDFVVQFFWKETPAKDRKWVDPNAPAPSVPDPTGAGNAIAPGGDPGANPSAAPAIPPTPPAAGTPPAPPGHGAAPPGPTTPPPG
jgi:type IV pilus assembly protein PilM